MVEIDTLYRKFAPMVLRRCRAILKSEQQALEAMQETFVRVLEHQEDLLIQSASSLLYQIATRVCLNHRRKYSTKAEVFDVDEVEQFPEKFAFEDRQMTRETLRALFSSQSYQDQNVAKLYFQEGCSHEEISQKLNRSVSGVRLSLRRFQSKTAKFLRLIREDA